jgi:cell division protein FtsB
LHVSAAFCLKPLGKNDSHGEVTRRPTLSTIRSAVWPAVAVAVIVYFAGAAIVGQNGLFSLAGYRHQRAERSAELATLKAEQARLEHHVDLLDPRHVDPDYAEEILRQQTGQVGPSEVIMPAN